MTGVTGSYRSGTAGQPPVLLLHSSQSTSGQWRALQAELNQHFDVLAVDLLGYGKAARPEVMDPDDFRLSDEIPRVLAAIEDAAIDHPVHLIGHSYGAALALKLAREQALPVRSLTLFEPVAFHILDSDQPARQEIDKIADQMHQADAEAATRAFVDYWNQPGYFDALPERIRQGMVRQAGKVTMDFAALMGEPCNAEDYHQIQVPTLLLTGAFSRLSAQQVAARLQHVLPQVETAALACGHMGPVTAPELVNPVIVRFLHQQHPEINLD
ncbi:alpha/beta hydrolase [Pseudidiomarina sp.]|uniref:alpha/beta fold hydrolase n=1 Tax=Pseudidiomarina sp. TaxID=2081707 RepID=UPI00299E18E2|nr:alpha/beta hydrolase [Pseudidiomarina sp.]MDX1705145.1 alpha/beta hydrolase [Pseudidiomarina sp.]